MRKIWVAAAVLCGGLWLGLTARAEAQADGRHVALVIGNGAYTATSPLKNPGNDAREMKTALENLGFQVEILLDARQGAMIEATRNFAEAAAHAEVAVVFYAGHGMELGTEENYLIPIDARLTNERLGRSESVSLRLLRDAAAGARRFSMVIVDACRTNSFPVAARGPRGMERESEQPSQIVFFSTQPGQIAEDGEGLPLSPFTAALTERLRRSPDQDVLKLVSSLRLEGVAQTPYTVFSSTFSEEHISLLRQGMSASQDHPTIAPAAAPSVKLGSGASAAPPPAAAPRLLEKPVSKITLPHPAEVTNVAFSPDGARLLTGSDMIAQLWDSRMGAQFWSIASRDRIGNRRFIASLAFDPTGGRFAASSGTFSGTVVQIINVEKKEVQMTLELETGARDLAFSPDGRKIAVGEAGGYARIWDADSGAKILELPHGGSVNDVAFSPDGSRILTGSSDKTAMIRDAETGAQLRVLQHEEPVSRVAFSPDGGRIATSSLSGKLRIWDADSEAEPQILTQGSPILSLAFSPDGGLVATGGANKQARIWDARTGASLMSIPHEGAVRSVAFSPDGLRLATGSDDKMARIWEIAAP